MASPNPYETPQNSLDHREDRYVRRYLPVIIGVLLIGVVITTYNPVLGVPATLVALPAVVRGSRVYWRKRQAANAVTATEWWLAILVSFFLVIPVSLVGLIAFCCVCTPVGWLGFTSYYPNSAQVDFVIFVAVYIGLAAGLLASLFLLKRLKYLASEERIALQADHEAHADRNESESSNRI